MSYATPQGLRPLRFWDGKSNGFYLPAYTLVGVDDMSVKRMKHDLIIN